MSSILAGGLGESLSRTLDFTLGLDFLAVLLVDFFVRVFYCSKVFMVELVCGVGGCMAGAFVAISCTSGASLILEQA